MSVSPHADLRVEPFSRFGSYLNVVRQDDATYPPSERHGLFLRHNHGTRFYDPLVAAITIDGQPPLSQWDEAVLTLRPAEGGGGMVKIVFDGTQALRLCGEGCSLELSFFPAPGASMYPGAEGGWEINARECRRKVLLRAQSGSLAAETDWQGEVSSHMLARFTPGDDGTWQGALDFYQSTWIPRQPRAFTKCEEEVRAEFARYLAQTLPCDQQWSAMRRRAAYVNWSAVVEPCGLFRRPAMLMSKVWMSQVWSWDHAFNAMALMPGDPQLAWDQMLLMADRQNEHGAFPDAHNDVHEHFNFCKPPIHGWALSHLRAQRPDFFTPERLRQALSWLEPWTRWWLNHRLWEGDGLPVYLHGNDSGWDNSTFFLQGVPVITPDLPTFLIVQCQELADLHTQLGQGHDAQHWRSQAQRLFKLLMSTLWNGRRFIALRMPDKRVVAADTLIEATPLLLGELLPSDVRSTVVARLQRYLTTHGLATEHVDSPHYTPDGYWRGPIWAPSTMLICDGLRRSGEPALAADISQRFVAMCAQSGFAENFNAQTGAPLRDKAYTWTASVALLLANQIAGAPR
ncbi:MAG: hypothetical protein EA402_12765 [Planctomycetota bacterium]|nr:MAG: hypothetical protein EA402_12765 [Planctomycetota bacterium]